MRRDEKDELLASMFERERGKAEGSLRTEIATSSLEEEFTFDCRIGLRIMSEGAGCDGTRS